MSSNVVKMKRLESVKLKLPAHVRACLYHLFGIFVFVFISNNLFHTLCTGLLGTLINGLGFGTLIVVRDSRCGSGLSLWTLVVVGGVDGSVAVWTVEELASGMYL